jgi:hypothetical protein
MPMPACPRREVRGPIQAHKRAVSVSILLRYLADAWRTTRRWQGAGLVPPTREFGRELPRLRE